MTPEVLLPGLDLLAKFHINMTIRSKGVISVDICVCALISELKKTSLMCFKGTIPN